MHIKLSPLTLLVLEVAERMRVKEVESGCLYGMKIIKVE
jgi:hypothetical protein